MPGPVLVTDKLLINLSSIVEETLDVLYEWPPVKFAAFAALSGMAAAPK